MVINKECLRWFNELLSVVDVWMFDISISYWLISDNFCLPTLLSSYCLAKVNYLFRLKSQVSLRLSDVYSSMSVHESSNHEFTSIYQRPTMHTRMRFVFLWMLITNYYQLRAFAQQQYIINFGSRTTNNQ